MGLAFGLFLHSVLTHWAGATLPGALLVGLFTAPSTSRNVFAVTSAATVLGAVFRAPLTAAALCAELCKEPGMFIPVLGTSWLAAEVASRNKAWRSKTK